MPVRKAIIPAAGLGTRFLPASKAVPKVLLPVVDRPVIQYAVEEIARAGVTSICIVTSRGQEAVADHFTAAPDLEAALLGAGKAELLWEIQRLPSLAEIYYIRQHAPLGLGHAVGVAREFAGDDPVAVVLPDELFDPGEDFLGRLISTFDDEELSVIAVRDVPRSRIRQYGAIDPEDPDADPIRVRSLVEKPEPETAPSTLASVGRYILTPQVFDALAKIEPGALGELQLTDALDVLARTEGLLARRHEGRRWDVGNKAGYLEAVVTLAAERDDLGPNFREFLRSFPS